MVTPVEFALMDLYFMQFFEKKNVYIYTFVFIKLVSVVTMASRAYKVLDANKINSSY